MILKSKKEIRCGKLCTVIYFQGTYKTLNEISKIPEVKKLELSGDVLAHRWRNGDNTTIRLFRKKRGKKPNKITLEPDEDLVECTPEQLQELGVCNPLIIENYGHHKECPDGYIYAGPIAEKNYFLSDFWQFQKLGTYVDNDGWRPLFIKESEILEKGWVIV